MFGLASTTTRTPSRLGRIHPLVLAVVAVLLVALAGASERADGAITGAVFRDYNQNGVRDNTAPAGTTPGFVEPFVSGIQVTAYDQAGSAVATATTGTSGTYSLGTTTGRYRVEFSIPGSKSFLQHGPGGSGSGTSVQFVSDGGTANFGVANPADYCQTQPMLATSCHRFGDANGPNANDRTVVRWPYTASSPTPPDVFTPPPGHASVEELATATEVGSTFGLAYHKTSGTLFTAAYMRRHVGFGSDGPMAIYQVPNADDATPGSPTLFADLNAVTGATSTTVADPHPSGAAAWSTFTDANFSLWFHDANAFDDVGKLGIGGIAVSEDDTTLWAVNLSDRTLVKMDLGTGATPTAPTSAGSFPVPTSLCRNAYAMRPFAVTERDGLVYVGGVCSGQTSASGKDATDLAAWVVSFDPTTSTWGSTPVLSFDSSYSREGAISGGANARFGPWKDTFAEFNAEGFNANGPGPARSPKTYQGMLTGITFTGDDMVVAFRPRTTDQFGNLAGDTSATAPSAGPFYGGFPAGEIVRACKATAGGWKVESAGRSATTGCATTFGPGFSTTNGGGPGGGEFYQDGITFHPESIAGGVTQIPGSTQLAASMSDPSAVCSAGAVLFDQTSGLRVREIVIYNHVTPSFCGSNGSGFPSGAFDLFGKANGIGDIEALCDKAPIQIGNRAFVDRDRDGIQDPTDPPLANVQVKLFAPGADPTTATPIGTTTTNAAGQYLFSSLTTPALTARTNGFQVVVDMTQSAIATPAYELTAADADGSTGGDLRDSDATLSGTLATITVETDGPGVNAHGYDFGFVGYSLGNRVWKDKDNSGTINAADGASPGVANASVALLSAASAPVTDPLTGAPWEATTDANGYYRFDGLPAGQFKIRIRAVNFQAGGALAGTFSSTADVDEDDPNADGESNDDGVDEAVPDSTGVTSPAITLGPLSPEPLAAVETDRSASDTALHSGGMPDGRTNLTLDFGFWDAFAVGNRVWRDLNDNGTLDAGDGATPGVSGVVLTLLTSTGGPVYEIGTATQRTATTNASGFYRFDKVPPGTYKVCAGAGNFDGAGDPLLGHLSSTATSTGPDADTDADDDGVNDASPSTNGICTDVLTVGPGDEPVGDLGGGPGHGTNGDAKSNLTVDLGFWEPYSLGNRVWIDLDNSGTINAADGMSPGRDGVVVNLFRDSDGDGSLTGGELTAIMTATTAGGGYYRFDGLRPGDYLVEVATSNFDPLVVGAALLGMRSSSTDEADPDGNVDANDNGIGRVPSATTGVRSGFVTLGTGNEPAADLGGGPGHGGTDLHSNLTLDFGFFAPLSVGNRIWIDADNSGTVNGAEGAPSGPVTVNLTTVAGGTVTDADGNPVAAITTSAAGHFRFDTLAPGSYRICVDKTAFASGAPLAGMASSTVTAASPDSDVDANDDGLDTATATTNGVCTGTITLTVGGEPATAAETGGTGDLAAPGDGPHGDANSNLTVDLGFFTPLSVGNRVWRDADNSGTINAPDGATPGIAGVKVTLTDAAGNPATDAFGAAVGQTTTDASGFYRFDNLKPGTYRVRVDSTSFLAGQPLEKMLSSTTTEASPDADVDANDNGVDDAAPATNGVRSGTITLGPADEPTGDLGGGPGHGPNGDPRSNLMVDFGFFSPLSVGNRVWEDKDNSGDLSTADGTAPWIAGVTVNLTTAAGAPAVDALGNPVAQATTDATGLFRFDNLVPGDYRVCVDSTSFAAGQPLVGMSSSGPTEADPDGGQDANDNGVNDPAPATNGICSGVLTLGPGAIEPTAETGGGAQGPTGDGFTDLTVDFGFVKGFSLGNRVWFDLDASGTINAADGATPGVAGVVVELTDGAGNPVADLFGNVVAPATTDASGFYRFDNLEPGDYIARVTSANFDATAPSPLQGMASTSPTEADPDGDVDANDNGVDGAAPATNGIASGVITIGPGAEPNGDLGDGPGHGPNGDAQGNLTLDFGFLSPVSVGNRVWIDGNNSGTIDSADGASPGAAGVKVNLTTAAGAPATDTLGNVVPQATTDADGFYRFDDLKPGTYRVCVDAASFASGQPLAGRVSSTVTAASPDGNVNSDDDGVDAPSAATTGVCTTVITLGSGAEPTGDLGSGPGDGPHGDASSNLTVDLGFFTPYSVGNRVWRDLDDSGTVTPADGAAPGVSAVTVNLTDASGNPVTDVFGATVAATTTNAEGFYRFDRLKPGVYRVVVDKSAFFAGAPLAGHVSSTPTEASPDDDADGNDNGQDVPTPATTGVRSGDITLGPDPTHTADGEPLAATETGGLGALGAGPHGDSHSNVTVDFGFFAPHSVGNRVWEDKNNSGDVDAPDGTAPGMAGVTVRLTTPAGAPVTDALGTLVAAATTDATGFFRFDNLRPGDYRVCVEASNFATGATLDGFSSSGPTEADPDGGLDANDNGVNTLTATTTGVCSGTLTLGPPDASEPVAATETGGGAQGPHGDAKSDLTVDFGFVKGFSLGNRVFEDIDNDGSADAAEPGIPGVAVRVTDPAGNPVTDVLGNPVGPATTDADGFYRFDLLKPGEYRVVVEAANFDATAPSPLAGFASSTTTEADPDADVDANDNGIDQTDPATSGVRSDTITLGAGEPLGETGTGPTPNAPHGPNGDSLSNLTVDFGFVRPFSVGNRVWEDKDNSGAIDAPDGAAPGIAGVKVDLRTAAGGPVTDAFGQAVGQTTTTADGFYRFDRLLPGDYVVCLDETSFATGGAAAGMTSSDPTSPTPNDDTNSDDNGVDDPAPATNGVCSGTVTLSALTSATSEPLSDLGADPSTDPHGDDHSNHTVDFGLYTPFSVGNRVWFDTNNSGTIDAADGASPGVAGVKVNLLTPAGAPATDINGNPVAQATTDADGRFRFDNLPPGEYVVEVDKTNFAPTGVLANTVSSAVTDPADGVDGNDDGIDVPSPAASGVRTGTITLGPPAASEPLAADETGGGAQGPHGDAHADLTVDLGFFHPYAIGNRVWIDRDNSGAIDAGDGATPGVGGVVLELLDASGAPVLDPLGAPIATSTNATGFYRFDDVVPGDYRVRVAASNFSGTGPLVDHISSVVTVGDPNTDADHDDNGSDSATPQTAGITSGIVTVADAQEPLGDLGGGSGHGAGGDSRSNLTLDFGFLKPYSLGNRVWNDADDSGAIDGGDPASPGIAGVKVNLTDAAGNPAKDVFGADVPQATTDADGFFRFDDLPPGTFKVCAERGNFSTGALRGMMSSTTTEASPDANLDANDNGIDQPFPATTGVCTQLVTLGPADEPTAEAGGGAQGPHGDAHANLTVDLGFFTPFSVGNRVWRDVDADGAIDAGEAGIGDVLVNLLDGAGNPAVDAAGNLVPQATTSAGGFFRFDNLPPGDYLVELSPDSFQPGNPLHLLKSSTTTESDPDTNVDANDNGIDQSDPATSGIRSGTITLGPGNEPTGDLGGAASHGPHGDVHGDLTVDFGLFTPLSVGNRVWRDTDNDGQIDPTESGIADVAVRLTDTAGDDVGSADGSAGPTSMTTTTDADGFYRFDNVAPGAYKVLVDAVNFSGGEPLHLHVSSTPTGDPDADVDANDDGETERDPATNGVTSDTVTLGPGDEPTGDLGGGPGHGPTGDARSNLTVDLGFLVPYTVGNRVWLDADNEGDIDAAEIGVNGVRVALRDAAGNPVEDVFGSPVGLTTTDASGFFRFANLAPGDYTVALVKENFADGEVLEALVSTTPTSTDPDDDTDSDDNGKNGGDPATDGIVSGVVTLGADTTPATGPDAEPLGDLGGEVDHAPTTDGHTNLTVDFAVYGPYSIGNRVWFDPNNDGDIDPDERGIADVVLRVLLPDGTVLGTANPTDASGFWRVDGLAPGKYRVEAVRANFAQGGPLFEHHSSVPTTADPNMPDPDNTDSDDNGIDNLNPAASRIRADLDPVATGGIRTGLIVLGAAPPYGDDEPLADLGGGPGHGPNGDAHSNLTLDMGFYPLAAIGDLVWDDRNHDGIQDPGEPPLSGVRVNLIKDGIVVSFTTTKADGTFSFTGLIPGDYQLGLVPPDATWEATTPGSGADPTADSNLDAATLRTPVTTLSIGERDMTQDLGIWRPAAIGDRIWHDVNANGVQDPGEGGVGGVRVALFAGGVQIGDTTTGPDGTYLFDKLVPGSYTVEVFPPAGWALTWSGVTTDTATDSDPNRNSHRTAAIAIDPGERELTVDGGIFEAATLRGIVFWDRNENGRREENEPLAPNARVWVTDPSGRVLAEGTTDENGAYEFANMPVGIPLALNFVPPKGWVLGEVQQIPVTLSPGEQRAADDTPIVRPTKLSITETGPPTARGGQVRAFRIKVCNAGPNTAWNVVLADTLGRGTTADLRGRTPFKVKEGVLAAALGDMKPKACRTVILKVRFAKTARGKVPNRSVAKADNAAPVRAGVVTRLIGTAAAAPAVTG